jgi:hypothetical protein
MGLIGTRISMEVYTLQAVAANFGAQKASSKLAAA